MWALLSYHMVSSSDCLDSTDQRRLSILGSETFFVACEVTAKSVWGYYTFLIDMCHSICHLKPKGKQQGIIRNVYVLRKTYASWIDRWKYHLSNMVLRRSLRNTSSSWWMILASWAPRAWQKKSASTQERFIRTFSSWNTSREQDCEIVI